MFYYHKVENVFLYMIQNTSLIVQSLGFGILSKYQNNNIKNDKFNYNNNKKIHLYVVKNTVSKFKEQMTNQEEYLQFLIVSFIYKELKEDNKDKGKQHNRKMGNDHEESVHRQRNANVP